MAAPAKGSVNVGDLLDPEIAPAIAAFPAFALSVEALADIRGASFPMEVELSDTVERTDHVVPGDPDVTVRVHRPVGASSPRPCVYSIHGGGYVIGSYEMDDPIMDRWCNALGIVGVSVEYRLAPDTPYPGPITDCYRGLKWTFEHAGELGIDPGCIGIRGVSAGGGLAAALALVARDQGEVSVAFQLLDCPMLDDRQITPSSRLEGLAVWSRESNEFGWRAYLGDRYGTDDVSPHAAPAARRTWPASRRHSSRSVRSTASATRTSTTRRGSTRPASPPSSTCIPAPATVTRSRATPRSAARPSVTRTTGSPARSGVRR